jgi:hypothetical protein
VSALQVGTALVYWQAQHGGGEVPAMDEGERGGREEEEGGCQQVKVVVLTFAVHRDCTEQSTVHG